MHNFVENQIFLPPYKYIRTWINKYGWKIVTLNVGIYIIIGIKIYNYLPSPEIVCQHFKCQVIYQITWLINKYLLSSSSICNYRIIVELKRSSHSILQFLFKFMCHCKQFNSRAGLTLKHTDWPHEMKINFSKFT